MTLQEIVIDYLNRNGLTQRQFAKKCGAVSHGYIHMLIKGPNPKTGRPCIPRMDTLEAIARGMGCTAQDLIARSDDLNEGMMSSPQTFIPEGQLSMEDQLSAAETESRPATAEPRPEPKPRSEAAVQRREGTLPADEADDELLIRKLAGRIRSSVRVDGADQKRLEALRRSRKLRELFDAQMKMSDPDLDYMLQFARGILMNK